MLAAAVERVIQIQTVLAVQAAAVMVRQAVLAVQVPQIEAAAAAA
jgi:hypothetical protein